MDLLLLHGIVLNNTQGINPQIPITKLMRKPNSVFNRPWQMLWERGTLFASFVCSQTCPISDNWAHSGFLLHQLHTPDIAQSKVAEGGVCRCFDEIPLIHINESQVVGQTSASYAIFFAYFTVEFFTPSGPRS